MINDLFQNVKSNFKLDNIIESLKTKKVYFVNTDSNNAEEIFTKNKIKYENLVTYKEDWYIMKLYELSN